MLSVQQFSEAGSILFVKLLYNRCIDTTSGYGVMATILAVSGEVLYELEQSDAATQHVRSGSQEMLSAAGTDLTQNKS